VRTIGSYRRILIGRTTFSAARYNRVLKVEFAFPIAYKHSPVTAARASNNASQIPELCTLSCCVTASCGQPRSFFLPTFIHFEFSISFGTICCHAGELLKSPVESPVNGEKETWRPASYMERYSIVKDAARMNGIY